MVPFIKEVIAIGGWLGAAAALFGVLWWFFGGLEKSEASRKRIESWLNHDTVGQGYRDFLGRFLDWVDLRLCSPEELALRSSHRARAWSINLLSFTLILALGYPLLSLALRWSFSNNGMVGGTEVLVPEARGWLRYATTGPIALAIAGFIIAVRKSGPARRIVQFVSLGLLILPFPLAAYFESSTAAAAGTGALAVAFAVAVAAAGTGAVAFAAAAAVAVAAAAAFAWLGDKIGKPALILLVWAVLGLVSAAVAINFTGGFDERQRGGILLMSLLPLLNGPADFASVGLTRYCLRRGLAGSLQWSALLDLIGAVLIFLALGFAAVAFIHYVQPQDDVPLLNLMVLFAELREPVTRGSYWWLLFMLFSTLVPTVIHATIAAVAVFTIAPDQVRTRIAGWLKTGANDDAIAARGGRLALAAAVTAAFIIPVFVIVESIRLFPAILDGTIWVFEGFARAIGAV